MRDTRIVFFDIETTHLKANFGYVLCFGYKRLGGRTHVLSIADYKEHVSDPTNDAALMRDVHRILTTKADVIVSYYGKEFDRKFLNTRMLLAGLPILPPLNSEHIDLYFTARGNLALNSNRLDMVARTLGCPIEKTPLDPPIWIKAMAGDRKAIGYVKDHCRRDVDVLDWCYNKLKPFVRQHPPVSMEKGACRVCGGFAFIHQGYRLTSNRVLHPRLQCKACGHWSQGAGR